MKNDKAYLLHIHDSITCILDYTVEGKDAFFADRKTQDAVVRNLEIIGKAVKRLSEDLKLKFPNIP